jgi:Protein of unknown function (DUF1573)
MPKKLWHFPAAVTCLLLAVCVSTSTADQSASRPFSANPLVADPVHLGRAIVGADAVPGVVRLLNSSAQPVRIMRVESSCGCLSVSAAVPFTIAAGGSFEVPISMKPDTLPTQIRQSVLVYAEGATEPCVVRVTLDVVADASLLPGSLNLGFVRKGFARVGKIRITNNRPAEVPLKINVSGPWRVQAPDRIGAGAFVDVEFSIAPEVAPGQQTSLATVTIGTNGTWSVPLTATVLDRPVTFRNSERNFGVAVAGRASVRCQLIDLTGGPIPTGATATTSAKGVSAKVLATTPVTKPPHPSPSTRTEATSAVSSGFSETEFLIELNFSPDVHGRVEIPLRLDLDGSRSLTLTVRGFVP